MSPPSVDLSNLGDPNNDAEVAGARLAKNAKGALPAVPAYPPFVGLPRHLKAIALLVALAQWVAWKYIPKPGKKKPDKVPFDPATGRGASSGDPSTWGTYAMAEALAKCQNMPGVGLMLSPHDDLTGIDLDNCRDPDTGVLEPWAAEVIAFAETYAEASPSGKGIRLFARGKVAKATKHDPAGIEIYGTGRYLTVTGRHVEGTPDTIAPAPKTLAALLARVEAFKVQAQAAKTGVSPSQAQGSPAGAGADFFRDVNATALANLPAWVLALLPAARSTGTGFRVTSTDIGRELEEDLSITPQGIVDFGLHDQGDAREGRRTPIDLVVEHRGAADPKGAALWLCDRLGASPQSLGWKGDVAAAHPGEWAEPKPLPSGLLPVEPFDPAMVPRAVAAWVMDVAERMQCPPDFVAVAIMVALGAVLGRKIAIRPQRHTSWFEVPNLWGCIVGRPGAMKSPAMAEALRPLDRLEDGARKSNAEARDRHACAVAEHKIRQEAATKRSREAASKQDGFRGTLIVEAPQEPKLKRYKCNDTTYEALGAILADNANGVLVFRDELVSLLKTLDREDNAAARGFYLSAWNGTSGYTFDRIMRGITHIEAACLSLLGSTQPGRLAAYVGQAVGGGAGDDGLMQRFSLAVWPDDDAPFRHVDRHPDSNARDAAFNAFARLDAITPGDVGAEQGDHDELPFLRFDDAAADLFAKWRDRLERSIRGDAMHPALKSHLSKYRKLVPTLALLNHLADGGTGPVTVDALSRALSFAGYLKSHAGRIYGSGQQAEVGAAKALLSRIRRGEVEREFTVRDVQRHGWSSLSDPSQIASGLALLDDLGWVRSRRLDTGGRPKMVFTSNPRASQRVVETRD